MQPVSDTVPSWLTALGPVCVMDAECALCSFGARMIHRLDRDQTIRILPIQSPRGAQVLELFGLVAANPETWLFSDGQVIWSGLEAMITLGAQCGGWGHALAPLRLLPSGVRRGLYGAVARNRYRLFGRADMCAVPDAGLRARILS